MITAGSFVKARNRAYEVSALSAPVNAAIDTAPARPMNKVTAINDAARDRTSERARITVPAFT
jgi:hypothetical protein